MSNETIAKVSLYWAIVTLVVSVSVVWAIALVSITQNAKCETYAERGVVSTPGRSMSCDIYGYEVPSDQ